MLKQVDLWVAGAYLDQETVALYAAAARLTLVIDLPLLVINSVIPALACGALYSREPTINYNNYYGHWRPLVVLWRLCVALLLVIFSTLISGMDLWFILRPVIPCIVGFGHRISGQCIHRLMRSHPESNRPAEFGHAALYRSSGSRRCFLSVGCDTLWNYGGGVCGYLSILRLQSCHVVFGKAQDWDMDAYHFHKNTLFRFSRTMIRE